MDWIVYTLHQPSLQFANPYPQLWIRVRTTQIDFQLQRERIENDRREKEASRSCPSSER